VIFAAVVAEASGATFPELMDHVAQGFEALGAAILVVGVVWSFVLAVAAGRRFGWSARGRSWCAAIRPTAAAPSSFLRSGQIRPGHPSFVSGG
jgi:hypothetical protein